MRGAEAVVFTLYPARKARDAAVLAELSHPRASPGEYLVRVSLVSDVPHQPITRRVEDIVQSDRELDRPEIRRQVSAGAADRGDDEVTQLARELRQLVREQAA